jgi:hypothetical protein
MKGKMLIYWAHRSPVGIAEVDAKGIVNLRDTVRGILEDDIEQIPLFNLIVIDDKREPCVALCGKHAKIKKRPVNLRATVIWHENIARQIERQVTNPIAAVAAVDKLKGTVIVLTGDPPFMEAL